MLGKRSRRRVDSTRQGEEDDSESDDNYSDSMGSDDEYIVAETDTSGICCEVASSQTDIQTN